MSKNTALAIPAGENIELISQIVMDGNIGKLTEAQKLQYYYAMCERIGLDPLSHPLQYLKLSSREVLYVTKGATDQIARNQGISRRIVARERIGDVYVVTAQASDKTGRVEESTGAISIAGLGGENLCNAMLKAESKAKRRAILSMCSIGLMDESEVDDIPGAQRLDLPTSPRQIAQSSAPVDVNAQPNDAGDPVTEAIAQQIIAAEETLSGLTGEVLDLVDYQTKGEARAHYADLQKRIKAAKRAQASAPNLELAGVP